jgi:biopolymer transport protein ExbD
MNVTPLIDVLLVLLIIFMILPPHHRGEKAETPRKSTMPAPDGPIVIQLVDAGGGLKPFLRINREPVTAGFLEERLTRIFQSRIEKTAFLKADPGIDFQYAAEVMDAAHRAGVDRVGLMDAKQ